ncbi:putative membrane protein [Waddlia chondrophila 2032/99]|uniref:Putative membrane protein n=2 Tax=Waddlia chondrophila TaxID=71667 RepID=D6YV26_WADCW|nr:flagellar biosynthetic protein FliO [Waddlia chondrophila]ADI37987.1 putative membrane protein [Waddlia chondrophila WSU 86-1044]CCB91872.1 putative membrane protein [Waddlia chondrophila 2032/99]
MKKIILAFLILFSPLPAQEKKNDDPLEKYPEYFAEELKNADQSGDSRFFDEFIQMMIYLTGIVAFMVLFMWILKRMMSAKIQQSNRSSAIKILESRTLSQKTTLYVVGFQDKTYTIAESLNGVTKLGETRLGKANDNASFDELMTP